MMQMKEEHKTYYIELSPEEERLINVLRETKDGKLKIYIKDRKPQRAEKIVTNIPFRQSV